MYLSEVAGSWFALQVRPRSERAVAVMLESKGYQHLLPTYRPGQHEHARAIEPPLFPGYVFCRFEPRIRGLIVTTPGVVRIVGFGKVPACLAESEVEAIRRICSSGVPVEPHPYVRIGDTVRVTQGPLQGVTGMAIGEGRASRLLVSVTLLQRAVAVEVDRDWLASLQV